jgi:glycosyltransferase involved in cell wall biosynthesis
MILISVVIALKNCSSELAITLDSLKDLSIECRKSLEVVIVDSNSVDYPYRLIAEYRDYVCIKFISEYDDSIYSAWNKAITLVSGRYLTFMGAGDTFVSTGLYSLMKYVSGTREDNIVSSKTEMVFPHGKKIVSGKKYVYSEFCRNFTTNHSGLLYPVIFFNQFGNYNLKYKIAADYEYLLRIGRLADFDFLDVVTTKYPVGGISSKSIMPLIEVFNIRKSLNVNSLFENSILLLRGIASLYRYKIFKW